MFSSSACWITSLGTFKEQPVFDSVSLIIPYERVPPFNTFRLALAVTLSIFVKNGSNDFVHCFFTSLTVSLIFLNRTTSLGSFVRCHFQYFLMVESLHSLGCFRLPHLLILYHNLHLNHAHRHQKVQNLNQEGLDYLNLSFEHLLVLSFVVEALLMYWFTFHGLFSEFQHFRYD